MSFIDYYEILGLDRTASDEEIKKAFKTIALECHPDHHPEDPDLEERFKRVTEAYSVLGDVDKRHAYDLRSRRAAEGGAYQSPEEMFWEFVQSEGFDLRKARCVGGMGRCRRGDYAAAESGKASFYEVSLTPTEAALGAQKDIMVRIWGNRKKCTFRVPAGIQSGSQLRLVLDRVRGISVLVRVSIMDRNGELVSGARGGEPS
jgi:DnaJ-class molecular chaperone